MELLPVPLTSMMFLSHAYLDMFKKHRQNSEHPKNAQLDIYALTSNFFNKFQILQKNW